MRRSAPILRLQIVSLVKMPPKRRKVQLAAARKNKALKNAINETLLNDDDDDDDELYQIVIISDDDWHDVELENNLDQISQTVFDVMIENAKKILQIQII